MNLRLEREPSEDGATIGQLYIEDDFECYTLEDVVRDRKIHGETAIPAGRYRIIINRSPRFKKDLPLLLKVPGYEGVRIHAGNTADDTEGCILVGKERDGNTIRRSREALGDLQDQIQDALDHGASVWLEIVDA